MIGEELVRPRGSLDVRERKRGVVCGACCALAISSQGRPWLLLLPYGAGEGTGAVLCGDW